jgi:hypothetical protein
MMTRWIQNGYQAKSELENTLNPNEKKESNNTEECGNDWELLEGFCEWLIDVDGGYRNPKIALQYKSQVRSIANSLKAVATHDQSQLSALNLLLLQDKEGVQC